MAATKLIYMKYYAEFNTDKVLRESFFPNLNYKGIIVEVGGATPEFLSMSKHFKDSGWRTIIVEPNPKFVELHKEIGNEVYQYACADYEGFGDFTIVTQDVNWHGGRVTDHSFSSISIKESYLKHTKINSNSLNKEIIKVEIKKLGTILDTLKLDKIDILSIDVEGWELDVMRGFDTQKIDCEVIVVENFLGDKNYNKYFEGIGYKLEKQIEYNQIYKKK